MVARAPALALLREQRQVAEQLALEQRPQVAEQLQRQQQQAQPQQQLRNILEM